MSKLLTIATLFFSMVVMGPVHAGSGHDHNADGSHSVSGHSHGHISSKKVSSRAKHKVVQLAEKGKIDKSWKSIKSASAEKKRFGKGQEWVVTFKNRKMQDKSKQTLYVFYSLDGHYIATNYTGK